MASEEGKAGNETERDGCGNAKEEGYLFIVQRSLEKQRYELRKKQMCSHRLKNVRAG